MSAEGPCAICMEDSDDLSCPGCVEDAVGGAVDDEREACAKICEAAWEGPKVTPGTKMALAIVARRIRERGLKSDETDE